MLPWSRLPGGKARPARSLGRAEPGPGGVPACVPLLIRLPHCFGNPAGAALPHRPKVDRAVKQLTALAIPLLLAACVEPQPVGYYGPGPFYRAPGYAPRGYGLPPPTAIAPPGYSTAPVRPPYPGDDEDRPQPDRSGQDRIGEDRGERDDTPPPYARPPGREEGEDPTGSRAPATGSPEILAPPPRPSEPAQADSYVPPPRVEVPGTEPAPPPASGLPPDLPARPAARTTAPSSSVPLLGFRPMRGQQGL